MAFLFRLSQQKKSESVSDGGTDPLALVVKSNALRLAFPPAVAPVVCWFANASVMARVLARMHLYIHILVHMLEYMPGM